MGSAGRCSLRDCFSNAATVAAQNQDACTILSDHCIDSHKGGCSPEWSPHESSQSLSSIPSTINIHCGVRSRTCWITSLTSFCEALRPSEDSHLSYTVAKLFWLSLFPRHQADCHTVSWFFKSTHLGHRSNKYLSDSKSATINCESSSKSL